MELNFWCIHDLSLQFAQGLVMGTCPPYGAQRGRYVFGLPAGKLLQPLPMLPHHVSHSLKAAEYLVTQSRIWHPVCS